MILLKSLLFEQKTENKLNVLFVGDSQTAANISYAKLLQNNSAINGKILAKVGASMRKIYNLFINNYSAKYDVVCIMGGNNDAGNTKFDDTSFKEMILKSKAGGSDVILITCPTMEYINTKMYPNKYPSAAAIPQWQLKLADEFNIPVINAYETFDDPRYFSNDGLHLNASAHKIIANKLINILSKITPAEISIEPETTEKSAEIKFGDSNENVQKIQTKLTDLGYSIGSEGIDSIFGIHTEDGVKAFQKNNNLSITGIVNKETLTSLLSPNAKRSTKLDGATKEEEPDNNSTKSKIAKTTKLSTLAKTVVNTIFPSGQLSSANVVVDFFIKKGLTKEQAIGIAANIQAESGFKTGILGDSGTSMGLAQWHDNRMDNLKTWTAENGFDYMSVDGQLEFLWHELNTSEKSALNAVQSTDTPEDAAYAFTVKFERPKNKESKGKQRSSIATSLADKLS